MNNPEISMEGLAQMMQEMQQRLEQANHQIETHRGELNIAAQKVTQLEQELLEARNNQASTSSTNSGPKKNKPSTFNGKGSIGSWCVQMENYLGGLSQEQGFHVALSYLTGNAHEWWIVYEKTAEGQTVQSWGALRNALIHRFETLNKEKIARDKLARWKQVKDVPTFNDDFNKILLDIPDIGVKDQIDRYSRGLKSYIWKALCTKEYETLADLMRDAERVESAYRRSSMRPNGGTSKSGKSGNGQDGPVPMEIGNVDIKPKNPDQPAQAANFELKKLTKEERERCMRDGLCLRCRQKGHLAKNCPKGRRN